MSSAKRLPEDHRKALRAAMRHDLGTFIVRVFQTVSPGDVYTHNWHIDAVAFELTRIHEGKNRRLIITQPPRSLKSICTSVAFVAWSLGHDPSKRIACVSYSYDLAAFFSRQFRSVVNSDWYHELFPNVHFTKDTEAECVTTEGGGRFVVPVGGTFTGRGGDIIIIDDPLKASDAQSVKMRSANIGWYSSTLSTRLDDKLKDSMILVQQRLHEDDMAGKLLREGGWHHLDLPAIAQEDQDVPIGPNAIHHRRKGDVLHPEREPLALLQELERQMGSLSFWAQYLQRPAPTEGNLLKRVWIKYYETAPDRSSGGEVVQSWDVASTIGEARSWSVCTTWWMHKRLYYLIDVWRGQLEFPQLKRKLIALAREHSSNRILIEQAGPGLPLIQDLRANPVSGVPVPIGIKPKGDKLVRMEAQCARFEAGQVLLPKEAPWLGELLHEILAFPHALHDDQIDSTSQFLNWAERGRPTFVMVGSGGKFFQNGLEITPSKLIKKEDD